MNIEFLKIAKKYPEISLLLLFGSRSRGQAQEKSDWDFGYTASEGFDSAALYTDLVLQLHTDKVDLVDLSHASGLLRYRAARDGTIIYEAAKGDYEKFWIQAVDFWCEAGPIFRAEYNAILEGL